MGFRRTEYTTVFVDKMPMELKDGVLYVAPHFNCAIHKCMCGCGEKVVTPLGHDLGGWAWEFDGTNVSLHPSVGNFQQPCKTHYFLKKGKVQWC